MENESVRRYHDIIILSVLSDAPSCIDSIAERIAEKTRSDYCIKQVAIAASISKLEKVGLITSFIGENLSGQFDCHYRLTQLGQKYLLQKRSEWFDTARIMGTFFGDSKGA